MAAILISSLALLFAFAFGMDGVRNQKEIEQLIGIVEKLEKEIVRLKK